MNIVVRVLFQISVFVFFTYIPRNDRIDHMVVLFLVFEEPPYYFSTVTAPIHMPTSSAQGSSFSLTLSTLAISCLSDSHSNKPQVVSLCGFGLHFPID